MKALIALTFLGITGHCSAETLTFSSFKIVVGEDWAHTVEIIPRSGGSTGERVSFRHPDSAGVLKLQALKTPNVVTSNVLRNMTNVDSSVPLALQNWGEFSGYQYDYAEGSSFFRQWWLVNQRTLVLATYESTDEPTGAEVDEINSIVNSLAVAGN